MVSVGKTPSVTHGFTGESACFLKEIVGGQKAVFQLNKLKESKSYHTRTNNLSLLLFFRANIDEVETEVVEIEAKLDKVRRAIIQLAMHFFCPSGPVFRGRKLIKHCTL